MLAPIPRGWGPMPGAGAQVEELRKDAEVALVTPDAEAMKSFGRNVLDPAARAGAARAGLAQAESLVDSVAQVWG